MADAPPTTDADSGTDGEYSTPAPSSAVREPTLPGTALPETSLPETSLPETSVTTAPAASHLSIGEVLALLLDEFPDVTISKIRFLESQGLIEPERTPSGYRKFYDADV
ncbi:MAG: MerR family transcriptional regulator, partial [Actinomycetota bacterium]